MCGVTLTHFVCFAAQVCNSMWKHSVSRGHCVLSWKAHVLLWRLFRPRQLDKKKAVERGLGCAQRKQGQLLGTRWVDPPFLEKKESSPSGLATHAPSIADATPVPTPMLLVSEFSRTLPYPGTLQTGYGTSKWQWDAYVLVCPHIGNHPRESCAGCWFEP